MCHCDTVTTHTITLCVRARITHVLAAVIVDDDTVVALPDVALSDARARYRDDVAGVISRNKYNSSLAWRERAFTKGEENNVPFVHSQITHL
jgi:hypothetical protein